MTADKTESTITGEHKNYDEHQSGDSDTSDLPSEIMDIMVHLSLNNKIVFKSQQRNEPEMLQIEKLKVAKDIYQRNPQTFLIRFGRYLNEKHLLDFARLSIAHSDEEMHLMVKDYLLKLKTRQLDVKNRRYAALQKLIRDGEYFSEQEMMKRSPELYHELVGQYLSNDEKKQRDSYDVKNTTFSGILMHNLEQKQISEIMEKAEGRSITEREISVNNNSKSLDEEESAMPGDESKDLDVPFNCRQQWGNFDNEQIACSSSKVTSIQMKKKDVPNPAENMITGDERDLLRQEFVSQMHEQFLSGQEKEFDYASVDDNTQFDDLTILNQDKEDKYFEESDDEFPKVNEYCKASDMHEDESEDELDTYMFHLNKHHSLQK